MTDLLAWMKSTRSVAVVLTYALLFVAIFMGLLDGKDVIGIALLVLGAYFGKDRSPTPNT